MIPDFTNPETKKDWFGKRQYLLDMGVDGFKTDGGEFIYESDLLFSGGMTGAEAKNAYAQTYTDAYTQFLKEENVLFFQSGICGSPQNTHTLGRRPAVGERGAVQCPSGRIVGGHDGYSILEL